MTTSTQTRIVLAVLATSLLVAVPAPSASAQGGADIEYEILSADTQDPLMIQVARDGRVIWIEREGAVKVLLPSGKQVTAGRIPVSANACDDCRRQDDHPLEEGGLHGLLLARNFDRTGRLYLYRSVPGSRDPKTHMGTFRLSTFVLTDGNKLLRGSERVILEVHAEWDHCCHYGGNLRWLPDGTILLATGDDVPATSSMGYGPRDTSQSWLNAEVSVQNPADRRGKILRLMPDGSVPDGSRRGIEPNPFIGKTIYDPYLCKKNVHKNGYTGYVPCRGGPRKAHRIEFDPYVYSLGYKQPWRMAVHPKTGTVYVSDVGPDAFTPDPTKGPRGYEEVNVVPPGGGVNHGWPRCIADNQPYHDYDWETGTDHGPMRCSKMEPAAIWYPHDVSDEWPIVGTGGVTNVPAVFYPASTKGSLRLPERFNNTLIDMDFMRNFIFAIPVGKDGSLNVDQTSWQVINPPSKFYLGVEALDPVAQQGNTLGILSPIDATIGPDGALYFLEYGQFFYNNGLSRVSRIKCAGCTPNPKDYGLGATAAGAAATSVGLPSSGAGAATAPPSPGVWVLPAIGAFGIPLALFGRRRRRVVVA